MPLDEATLALFARHYQASWDHRTAAARAGISRDEIVEALGSEIVQRTIAVHARLAEEGQAARDVRCEEVRAWLWGILTDDAEHDDAWARTASVRIRAADKLLKSYGGYIHRVQLAASVGRSERRGLTDEQADSIRERIFGQRPRLVIAGEGDDGR